MKTYFLILCGLFLSTLTFCKNTSSGTPIMLSDFLRQSYLNEQAVLAQPREPVEFVSGKKASDCHDYLTLKKTQNLEEGVNNTLIAQNYLICDTLDQLNKTSKVVVKPITVKSRGELLARYLVVDSYPSSLYQKTDDKHNTLTSLLGDSLVIQPNGVVSDTNDWYYELQVVAIADIDNNGQEDWLIWLTDKAKQGNYNVMSLLIAFNVRAQQLISVKLF